MDKFKFTDSDRDVLRPYIAREIAANPAYHCECGDEDCDANGFCLNAETDMYDADITTGTTAYDID